MCVQLSLLSNHLTFLSTVATPKGLQQFFIAHKKKIPKGKNGENDYKEYDFLQNLFAFPSFTL